MSHIVSVLRFGWRYLSRYQTRLVCGVLLSVLFALANGSFVWAARTLAERFAEKPAAIGSLAAGGGGGPAAARPSLMAQAREFSHEITRKVDPWLPRVGQPLDWRQVAGVLLFLPMLVLVRSTADYLSNYCMGWVAERVIRDVRLDVMDKLSSLSLDFFSRSTSGDLLTRINVDSANLLRALRQGAADLLKEPFTLVVVLVYLCIRDWQLTLGTAVLLPLCLFPLLVLGKKARRAMKSSLRANISQSSQLVELLGGIRIIKAYNLEKEEMARFRRTSSNLVHAGMKSVQAKELTNPLIEVISMFGLSLLLFYVFSSGRTGADMAEFLAGIAMLFLPVKKLAAVHIVFQQAHVGTERLIEILNEQPTVVEAAAPKPVHGFRDAIRFEEVTFAYRDEPVLREFSLVIPRGHRLGIAGESGSGKTTVLNLLFRFYDPTRGAVRLDGLDLREISLRDLRQQLALVSQDVVLFDQTVAENIACGRSGASFEEVEAAARAASAHDFILALPQGYDTRVGERGVTLSGGQRQRVAIARAFVRNAPILVLDEATAALDSKAEAEVQAAIDRLAEHRTVICVAHRLSTLAGMDQIIVLSQGCIVETGSFKALLNQGGIFAAMAARQGLYP